MDRKEILSRVDHTILTPTATWEQVKAACDTGRQLGVASVCVPPRYVKRANDYAGSGLKLCTVIGFPNGYSTPEVKVFETEDAIRGGADEIDMVVNLPKNLSSAELSNGYKVRRAAIDLNIPLLTNARLASTFIKAFTQLSPDDIQIKSWDEYK